MQTLRFTSNSSGTQFFSPLLSKRSISVTLPAAAARTSCDRCTTGASSAVEAFFLLNFNNVSVLSFSFAVFVFSRSSSRRLNSTRRSFGTCSSTFLMDLSPPLATSSSTNSMRPLSYAKCSGVQPGLHSGHRCVKWQSVHVNADNCKIFRSSQEHAVFNLEFYCHGLVHLGLPCVSTIFLLSLRGPFWQKYAAHCTQFPANTMWLRSWLKIFNR